ncbi:MAG: hypothetical protein NZ455_13505 [Bacteroidia bacterium]|nr:hypothetical protein [Bacteroidia bacterium]MDW8347707.1 hypothetical protein [Bacteroidia bacterium]
MWRACVSTVRSAAQHRSDSAARSTPTRAQRGTRLKLILSYTTNNKLLVRSSYFFINFAE